MFKSPQKHPLSMEKRPVPPLANSIDLASGHLQYRPPLHLHLHLHHAGAARGKCPPLSAMPTGYNLQPRAGLNKCHRIPLRGSSTALPFGRMPGLGSLLLQVWEKWPTLASMMAIWAMPPPLYFIINEPRRYEGLGLPISSGGARGLQNIALCWQS